MLPADNPSVLAYARQLVVADGSTRTVVCVNNLSRFAQSAEVSFSRFEGTTPIELIGRAAFPVVSQAAYPMTLGGYGYYWLEIEAQ